MNSEEWDDQVLGLNVFIMEKGRPSFHLFPLLLKNPEVGPAGQFGLPVVDHAEAEVRPEDELAPRPHPPMVGLTV